MDSLAVRGLRSKEDEKFIEFFKMVQNAAEKEKCVFFLNVGDGREIETESFSGEDLFGWLVPNDQADEFEKQWSKRKENDEWEEFETYAIWDKTNEEITIRFALM